MLVVAPVVLLIACSSAGAAQPRPPMLLPGGRVSAATQGSTWIVGARPTATARRIAASFKARSVLSEGTAYVVRRGQARGFAAALRRHGLLAFAEPNWRARRSAFPQDPLFGLQGPLQHVVSPTLTPPPITATSPLLAVADAQIDASNPEFVGTQLLLANPSAPVTELHGTAVASVAAAAANGVGMVGVWPGMRVLGEPNDLTCAGDAAAVNAADRAGASVINMSYGGPFCYAEYLATSYAFGDGDILVASGGNDFTSGNHIAYPASDPHVLTVAATDESDHSAFFSTENPGIDIAAPGVNILVAVPPALDDDGTRDGYQLDSGTSFSAPIVSAAAAWLEAARPGLANDQYMDMLRFSSDDLGTPGWDQAFGYGRLDLARALSAQVGFHDVGEPNDDIPWVNGTLYRHADKLLFDGHPRTARIDGLIDEVEDPADVFRALVPAHSTVRFMLRPLQGNPDLILWSRRAKTIYSRKHVLGRSRRTGKHTDTVRIHNRGRHAELAYVAIGFTRQGRLLNAAYRLTIKR